MVEDFFELLQQQQQQQQHNFLHQSSNLVAMSIKPPVYGSFSTVETSIDGGSQEQSSHSASSSAAPLFKLEDFLNISLDDEEEGYLEAGENHHLSANEYGRHDFHVHDLHPASDFGPVNGSNYCSNISSQSSIGSSNGKEDSVVSTPLPDGFPPTRHSSSVHHQSTQTTISSINPQQYTMSSINSIQKAVDASTAVGGGDVERDENDEVSFCSYVDPFADLLVEQKHYSSQTSYNSFSFASGQQGNSRNGGEYFSSSASPPGKRYQYRHQHHQQQSPYYIHQVEFTRTLELRRKKLDHLMVQLRGTATPIPTPLKLQQLLPDQDDVTMTEEEGEDGDITMNDGSADASFEEYHQSMVPRGTANGLEQSCNSGEWKSRAAAASQRPLQAY